MSLLRTHHFTQLSKGSSMRVRSLFVFGLVAGFGLAGAVAPVNAASAPKPGSSCTMSGETRIASGRTYVCTSGSNGATWSKGLKRSVSPLTIDDTWVKAANSGMTSGFGVITNPTDEPIRIIGARSPRFAGVVQLHDVAMQDGAMQMKEIDGGFVIPAGGSLELKPGAEHLMMMKMKQPVTAGEMVPMVLITSDGGQLRFKAMGKAFAGANESYDDGMK